MLNKCWHKRFSVSNIMPMSVLLRMFYLQAMALCLLNGGGRTGVAYKLRHWSRSLPEHSTSIPSSLAQVATLSSKRFFGNSIRSLLLVGGTASLSFPSKTSQNAVAATTLSSKQSILKRASDNREYKALTLDNGMRVLLISDIACTRAAAAVDVHVGSFSDPAELPGLAHFCEHMSFLGTQKYPDEDDFSNYLAEHGGSSNAYTDSEDTVYVSSLSFLIPIFVNC